MLGFQVRLGWVLRGWMCWTSATLAVGVVEGVVDGLVADVAGGVVLLAVVSDV